jgi:hypothetical protein
LHKAGIKIHLHAFEYGRLHSKEIEAICSSVNYYLRDTSSKGHFSLFPYSVVSRRADQLLINLLKNDYPVLFDGIQTTFFLDNPALAERTKAVRVHNIEPRYYNTLARYEKNLVRKLYYFIEAFRLWRYEMILRKPEYLMTVSIVDHEYYNSRFHNSVLIPSSHPYDSVGCTEGTGDFILYHGDLSVNENVAVAGFLISKVFSKIPYPCVIAGKKPPENLKTIISKYANIKLVADPDTETMDNLIRDAHINVIPTMAANGLKLKLLISLYCGRHCVVNSTTINGSGLYSLCHIADTGEKMVQKITGLMGKPFTQEMIEERRKILVKNHDNKVNATKLIDLLFPEGETKKV